ncbi:MAG: hypothetical protein EHM20_12650, partial [Alphaproteobacteria bacterium]
MEKTGVTEKKFYALESDALIVGIVIAVLLYIINLENYLLFHTLAELFSAFVSYIVFLVIWKARNSLLNKYLLLIGISYFFVGTFDLLHGLAFTGIGLFPGFDSNLSTQFWIIARYIESISFLIASLSLVYSRKNDVNNPIIFENSHFARTIFFLYVLITSYLLISIIHLKSFPISYIEGSGVTS